MSEVAQSIRPAAVAGSFYPGTPAQLRQTIDQLIGEAGEASLGSEPPKALIVPHAGYIYSGAAAARAIQRLAPERDTITRIVLLGPCHRVPVRGLAVPLSEAFETPLGVVPVDRRAIDAVASHPAVVADDRPHADEHSLEVQLPLLQTVLSDFAIAPFAVGQASAADVAAILDTLWGGPETRIVISSDLSHFLTQSHANQLDEKTALAIERLDGDALDYEQACGRIPICGLLSVAKQRNLTPERIALLTSADTAGSPDRVVGYGAWAFR